MKTLFLLRHAKSEWSDPDARDFDRALNPRGIKAAGKIGSYMRREGLRPSLVLCSPAERARQTAAIALRAAGSTAEVRYDVRIYEASVSTLIEVVSQVEERVDELMLVGHNPSLEGLLLSLAGHAARLPTAALVQLSLDIDKWTKVGENCGRMVRLVKAKSLEDSH